MIIEKRTYTFHPGKVQEFLALYEAEGLALHTKYLKMIGYFVSEIGTLNQVITMWGYDSMAQRDELGPSSMPTRNGSRSAPRQRPTSRRWKR